MREQTKEQLKTIREQAAKDLDQMREQVMKELRKTHFQTADNLVSQAGHGLNDPQEQQPLVIKLGDLK
ncbi:hypothetical protein FOQG_17122 [Fusarium oxysporum f. sp. raphani 54005]|uniref:Uncharacterized protein n=1 Tax=Fusarium oxysporum f. sp. raphani 54005 TaxID=1089458 RepID=X0BH94_FUSOX|nr:hypothetical protein FOQG_17122 [Fusarium oxysporum f. sp. raphani 54005]